MTSQVYRHIPYEYSPTATLIIPEAPSLSVLNEVGELTVAVQMYSPESLVSTEPIVAVLV